LGYEQNRTIQHKKMIEKLMEEFTGRINKIVRTKLNSRNLTKAINTYAVPLLTYSFGIVKWSKTELESLERKLRVILAQNNKLHPNAAIKRQKLPRTAGDRGIIDISSQHTKQIYGLKKYFHQKAQESEIHRAIEEADKGYTVLNLNTKPPQRNPKWNQEAMAEKISRWKQKSLHGRYPAEIEAEGVDKMASFMWLRSGSLFPETEGFIMAIQDQVVSTKNYKKYIQKEDIVDTCRVCGKKSETIQHIIAGCEALASAEYTERHNNVAKILHRAMVLKYKKKTVVEPYYKYEPEKLLEDDRFKVYWDRMIMTNYTVAFNRPDITVIDKSTGRIFLIDVAVPNTSNVERTLKTKIEKYAPLASGMKKQMKATAVTVLPIVISATGIVPEKTMKSLNTLMRWNSYIIEAMQKTVLLATAWIVRRVIGEEQWTEKAQTSYSFGYYPL